MTVLERSQIRLNGTARHKDEAIAEAAEILVAADAVLPGYVDSMRSREEEISTYMGNLLAIPHGTEEGKDTVLDSAVSFVRYDQPLDWGGEEVRFVVGIAGKDGGHLALLAKIALVFSDEDDVARLLDAKTPEVVLDILRDING
ncbi:PTS sugar transporter subunit IIA [Herbiconiux sp. CPCC 205763]|uniref:Mannitol-specific phosphotransferase enzyme IIA component n=1 Tax=Herbiconiux aconitum TaxID=2970913 RepID=A0ABT2GPS1_9MICO|nr:PTS sugar transporter subunit IIA [Herbiconiux aconitum]MCS5718214.1 PTS sugar transporter subunit IIA [Herbiconiux aconitum]